LPPPLSTPFPSPTLFRSELDAAALAAPAGMDLRLDDPRLATELARRVFGLGHGKARNASRRRHAVLAQYFLTLILVNVHVSPPRDRKSTRLNSSHDQISY